MLSEEKGKGNWSMLMLSFSVLTMENKKFLLELNKSLLMRDKPSSNTNIRSAPLYLFDKV